MPEKFKIIGFIVSNEHFLPTSFFELLFCLLCVLLHLINVYIVVNVRSHPPLRCIPHIMYV